MPDENGKITREMYEVVLFEDFIGNRVNSDKRFPNATIRLSIPAPLITIGEEDGAYLAKIYGCDAQAIFNKGVKSHSHGEADWDILRKTGDAKTDEAQTENVVSLLGEPGTDEFIANCQEFFETALKIEAKPKVVSADKQAIAKMKGAGIDLASLTPEKIARMKAMLAEEAEEDDNDEETEAK